MKAVWLLHTRISWVQQRHLSALSQKCVPCLGEWAKQRNPFIRCKTMDHLTAVTCHRRFSTEVASGVEVPISATEQLENLTPEQREKLEKLKVEVEIMRAYGEATPGEITDEMWAELLQAPGYRFVKKKLRYWTLNEKKRKKKLAQKERNQEQHLLRKARNREKFLEEGLQNTYHMHIRESTMLQHYLNNLHYALINGPTVVFDMGFEHLMQPLDISLMANQIQYSYAVNKIHPEPLHIHFCGLSKSSHQYKSIAGVMPKFEDLPMTVSEEGYLDIYPKEKLVYLSPNAPVEMKRFNEDDVYIIGGHMDRPRIEPVTWVKAKQQGLRAVRLPLERYLRWGTGSKCLTLDQVMAILLDLRRTGDWNKALKHIPRRKLRQE